MNRQTSAHLNYDQLLQVVVDKDDLGSDALAHLASCPTCQRQASRLVQRYDHLGKMAKKMAPEPVHAFRVPEGSATAPRRRFKPALALSMVGAMMLLFTVWSLNTEFAGIDDKTIALNSEIEDPLMDDIDALVADALPLAYQELASVSDTDSVEDLIDWIVPSIEDEDDIEPRA